MCRMKTMFKSFALVAIAALSLAACSKNEAPINDENDLITLKFNIKNTDEASTRALLGDDNGKKFLNWENGDKIGTFSVGTFSSNTASNNNSGTVEVSGDNYTLNVQTFWSGTITNIYSYFPFSAAAGKDKTAAIVNIPGSQFMTTDGFDADAMPMAGTPVSVDLTTTAANTDTPCGTINFFNLGSIINFKIYSSIETDETLTSVKYVAGTGNLGGNYTVDLTAIDGADERTLALVGEGSEAEITTTHRAKPVIGTGKANAIDVYMVVAPGSYSGTQVVVTTSAKTYTLNASGVKTYTRSSVKPMYVDIQNGTPGDLPVEETWTKVTKASDFTAGTYYILRGDGAYYLPNASATSGAPACVAYNAGDAITNAMKWTATAGDNGLVFESAANAGYYLWGANTNNGVRVAESSTASGASNEWIFTTVAVGGTTYYTAYAAMDGTKPRYLTSYGTQDWRNYTSASATNIPAEFYKLQAGDVPQKETPELAFNNPTSTVNVEETVTNVATITPSTLAITYSSSNEEVATVTNAGVVTGVAAGTATITAAFAGNDEYNAVSVSYDITVVDPNANDGSEAKPYTASEAIAVAEALGTDSREGVYVKGIVSTTGTIDSRYNSVTYYISDDGSTTNQFEAYSGKYISGADFTEDNNLKLGDYVVVCGTLKYYKGQAEFDYNNEVVSILRAPTFDPDEGVFTTDNLSVVITAETGATIRFTTDGTNPTSTTGSVYNAAITLSETTTVKAIAVKNGLVSGVVSKVYTKNNTSAITETLIVGTNGNTTWSNGVRTESATVGDVAFTALFSVANDGKYYSSDNSWRFYTANDSGIKITVPTGKKITSVVIKWKTGIPVTPSGFTAGSTTSPTTYTANSSTSVNEVSFVRGTANFLAQEIAVTYE